MVTYLARLLGLQEITFAAKWAVRLVLLALVLLLLLVVLAALTFSETARETVMVIAALAFAVMFLKAVLARRKVEPEAGERTIDGKVVPEMLAAAALDIPAQSPDGDYVLRGLPDYGKILLKLDSAEFAYIPDPPEERPQPQPVKGPAVNRPLLAGVPRWGFAVAAAVVVAVLSMLIYQAPGDSNAGQGHPVSAKVYDVPQPVAATEAPHESATPPVAEPVAAQAAPAPAPPVEAQGSNNSSNVAAAPVSGSDIEKEVADGLELANRAYLRLGIWRDPSTSLLWPKKDNGPEPIRNWQAAKDYCESLEVNKVTGWRLPTSDELNAMWVEGSDGALPGGIQRSHSIEALYSSTLAPDGVHHFTVDIGTIPKEVDIHDFAHALCVHD